MNETATATTRGWRDIERYVYVERPYDDVWFWVAGHLSTIGDPLPGGGRAVDLRVRPGGLEVHRPVRLQVGGVVCHTDRARAGLGWADAARPRAFPQLEGVLEIAPVPHDGASFTQLGVLARYRPPLGPLGAVGDRLVGAEVVDASLTRFLEDLAGAVEAGVAVESPAPFSDGPEGLDEDQDPQVRRLLLTVNGLAVRRGGATGACRALAALRGVVHVSLDPWTGLAAVDHDPARCGPAQMTAALEEQASAPPAM